MGRGQRACAVGQRRAAGYYRERSAEGKCNCVDC